MSHVYQVKPKKRPHPQPFPHFVGEGGKHKIGVVPPLRMGLTLPKFVTDTPIAMRFAPPMPMRFGWLFRASWDVG